MRLGRTLSLLLACHGIAEAATYSITDLGTLGGAQSSAYGINSSGQVVGQAATTEEASDNAVLFGNPNTGLGTFGGTSNQARAINSSGVVVGSNTLAGNSTTRAFAAFGKTVLSLGTLGGTSSFAYAVNDAGQIAGSSQLGGDVQVHAFRYQNGTMTDISTLGGPTAIGYAINVSGHIAGQSDTVAGPRAFLATDNTSVSLNTLGTGDASAAYAINDNDQVVGESNTIAAGSPHPFLYQNGTMTDLGLLASGDLGRAYAINNSSQIVGESNLAASGTTYHAFLSQGGQMTDLNDLIPQDSGWVLNEARAINASGQIAGTGTINGQIHAFLLTSISSTTPSDHPRVYINGRNRIVTEKPAIRMEGSVGGPVVAVKYRVGHGAYRAANGGTNGWRFKTRLQMGRNVIRVVAIAAGGAASYPAKVVVVRTHS